VTDGQTPHDGTAALSLLTAQHRAAKHERKPASINVNSSELKIDRLRSIDAPATASV